jgi:BlaR1 peptidase M56/Carboxypeptidase regulatory-like domain
MIRFVDGTLDPFLGFLADWSIRWGLLIVALVVWLRFWPPRRAATRHLLCATALGAGLALPFAPRWAVPWHQPPVPRDRPSVEVPIAESERLTDPRPIAKIVEPASGPIVRPARVEAPRPVAVARLEEPAIERVMVEKVGAWRWVRLGLGAAWLAGTVLLLARLMIGRAILARLRSAARPLAGSVFTRSRAELGSRRGSALASHPAVGSPVVLGGLAPMILVPDDWDGWPEASQRACLLHELAHLDRRDDLMKFVAELARVPFWFHPAVGWLLARLDREAELACDEAAVGLGVAPFDLAHLLLEFARKPRRLDLRGLAIGRQALSFFDRSTVSTRITRLLEDDMARAITSPSKFKTLGLAAIVAALALAIGGASVRAIETANPQQPAEAKVTKPAPASSFVVVVKDEEGHPIKGATVVAGIIENGAGREATLALTGDDGSARFDREPKPEIWVVAYKEGHSFTCRNLIDPTGVIPTPLALPRPRSLAGNVKDGGDQPIEGAEVRVEAAQNGPKRLVYLFPSVRSLVRGTPIEQALVARTDPQGNFRFESLPAEAGISLKTSAEGKATTRTQSRTSFPADPTRIVLAPEARLSGVVISQVPGVNVAGRTVTLKGVAEEGSATLAGNATTDAQGRFEIGGLGAGKAFLLIDDVPPDGPWTFEAALTLLTPGKTAEVGILVTRGVAVEGRVISTDGRPIGGAGVAVFGARNPRMGPSPVMLTTDASGVYRLRLAPGAVDAILVGRVAGFTNLDQNAPPRIQLIPQGVATFTLPPIEMAPAVGLFRGRIVDAKGVPMEGAKLIGVSNQTNRMPLNQANRMPLNQPLATTDARGQFSLDTQADGPPIPLNQSVTFQVRLADGKEFDASLVPTDTGEVTIKLPTLRDGGPKGPEQVAPDELAGMVIDTQGRPIEGVLAHAYSWIPKYKVLTDKEGRFRIKLPEQGKIEIRLSKEGYEPRQFMGQPTGQAGWVVAMGDRTYFEGHVLAPDGSPVADAPIRADSGPKRMGNGSMMRECWTEGRSGKDGRYRLYVEPGMYEFQVQAPGHGVARLPKQAIATDEARTLDIPLVPGADFVAKVIDSQNGNPVTGFLIRQDWRNPTIAGASDAEGILRISAMIPGKFSFGMIEADGYARWWSDACLSQWSRFEKSNRFGFQRNFDGLDFNMEPGMAPVTIIAEKAVTIRGRVLDPDGKPVAGATVAPALTGSGNSLTGDTRFSVETDKDGAFTMKLPASGEIAYNLVAHDGKYQQWRTWANGIIEPFRTTPGLVMEDMTLHLTRPSTVRGRVVDAAGQPVAGREVRASAADKRENRYYDPTTKTGADGTFELRFIRAGQQHIQVYPFWLDAEQAPAGTNRTLTLAEGETREGVNLTAAPER